MNLRIISGKYGGRTIKAPDTDATHPMGDRVRGSLFNILGNRFVDATVLDIFAGTGSLGLEALSRGAIHSTFIERDRVASRILAENISSLGVSEQATAIQISAATWINQNQDKQFDIIFVDPPYHDMQYKVVAKLAQLLKSDGVLVLSHPEKLKVPDFEGLTLTDNRNYGTAELGFYKVDASITIDNNSQV